MHERVNPFLLWTMETQLKLLKLMRQDEKDLVHGYVRLNTSNKDVTETVPLEIVTLILAFYFSLMFNTELHGDGFEFADDG